jgi:hypothetical protein
LQASGPAPLPQGDVGGDGIVSESRALMCDRCEERMACVEEPGILVRAKGSNERRAFRLCNVCKIEWGKKGRKSAAKGAG